MEMELSADQVLGAYLGNEMSPEERAAITRLLEQDPALKVHSEQLRELIASLKGSELQVTPEMRASLKQRVEKLIAQYRPSVSVEALISASLSDDLDANEKAALQKHFLEHPEARKQVQSLTQFTQRIKDSALTVTPALTQSLAERLRQKLPPGAIADSKSKPAAKGNSLSGKSPAASAAVRVFAMPESRWSNRLRVAGVAAAIALTVFGLSKLTAKPQETVKNPPPVPEEHRNVPGVQEAPGIAHAPLGPKSVPPPIVPDQRPLANDDVRNKVPPEQIPNPNKEAVAPQNNPAPIVKAPDIKTPNVAPSSPEIVHAREIVVPDNKLVPDDNPLPNQPKEIARPPDKVINGGSKVVNATVPPAPPANLTPPDQVPPAIANGQNNPAPNPAPAPAPDTAAEVADMAVVGAVRDGIAQAEFPDRKVHALRKKSEIPSGSEIVTSDKGRLALLMPGGHLYIDKGTSLKLEFSNDVTRVTLHTGQINYKASQGGSLALKSHGIEVANARSVNTQIQGNNLIVSVLDKSATVGPRGKTITVQKGSKAVASLDQDVKPEKEQSVDQPDDWHNDLILPGDAAPRVKK